MFLAQVRGNVVTTQKVPKMAAKKMLIVEPLRADEASGKLAPTGRSLVAVDFLDAGTDDIVLITQGSSARLTDQTGDSPVDCVVVGVVDCVTLTEKMIYRKGQ